MSAEAAQNAEQPSAELATPAPPPQGLTVLVCGDRHWSDGLLILRTLQSLGAEVPKRPPAEPVPQSSGVFLGEAGSSVRTLQGLPGVSRVIHGGCRGADLLGGWAARRLGIPVEVYPADWERDGRAAGPRRNERMLREGHPDLVLAFHDDLNQSLGTRDTLIRATQARIPFRVISHARPEGTGSKALASLLAYAGRRVGVPADSPPLQVAPVQMLIGPRTPGGSAGCAPDAFGRTPGLPDPPRRRGGRTRRPALQRSGRYQRAS